MLALSSGSGIRAIKEIG